MVGYHDDILWGLAMALYVANTTFKEIEKNKNKSAAIMDSWVTNTSVNKNIDDIKPQSEKFNSSTTYATTNPSNPNKANPFDPFRPQNPTPGQIYKDYGWLFGKMGRGNR